MTSPPPGDRAITVAGAAGMWGDSSLATPQILADGRADYVVYEALAEVTMAILARAHARDPGQGFARDIIATIGSHLGDFADAGMKVVTNAGGVNPVAAATALRDAATTAGLDVAVATVTGDDLHDRVDDLQARGVLDPADGAPVPDDPLALHAYVGARPIAAALGAGADVVITGRVVDSALTLGPLVHEFGWAWDDHDRLSAGSLAGHLVECGPQATGGLLTDWEDTDSWADPGYPLAIVTPDGHTTITTSPRSDGLVDDRTVTEQLLYEIGDPRAYLLPDVTCDWADVRVEVVGRNEVAVTGARGGPAPATLKACAHLPDGFMTTFLLFIGGRDAVGKARRVAHDLLARGRRMLATHGMADFTSTSVEVLGSEATYGAHGRRGDTREVILALGVSHADRNAIVAFQREVPSIGLAGPPGVSGGGTGLPRIAPVLHLATFPVPRDLVDVRVDVDGEAIDFPGTPADSVAHQKGDDPGKAARGDDGATTERTAGRPDDRVVAAAADAGMHDAAASPGAPTAGNATAEAGMHDAAASPSASTSGAAGDLVEVPLVAVAHGRSGDKGADVNIGIRARHPDFLPVLAALTTERIGDWLAHLGATSVERFELPGIDAVNFLLHDGLGTASAASLRFDPQGKAVAQQVLDIPVRIPIEWRDHPAFRHP